MALEATGHSGRFWVGAGLYRVARASAWAFGACGGNNHGPPVPPHAPSRRLVHVGRWRAASSRAGGLPTPGMSGLPRPGPDRSWWGLGARRWGDAAPSAGPGAVVRAGEARPHATPGGAPAVSAGAGRTPGTAGAGPTGARQGPTAAPGGPSGGRLAPRRGQAAPWGYVVGGGAVGLDGPAPRRRVGGPTRRAKRAWAPGVANRGGPWARPRWPSRPEHRPGADRPQRLVAGWRTSSGGGGGSGRALGCHY